jgi:uncharacterized protein (UPF0276 family)
MNHKVHIEKHLSDHLSIQDSLNNEYDLAPLLFNHALEYVIKKVQEN